MSEQPDETPEDLPDPPGLRKPEHPDFDRLVSIAEGIDREASTEGFNLEHFVSSIADVESASYLAVQRSLRIMQITNPAELQAAWDLAMKMAALYTEAFVVGYRYAKQED